MNLFDGYHQVYPAEEDDRKEELGRRQEGVVGKPQKGVEGGVKGGREEVGGGGRGMSTA